MLGRNWRPGAAGGGGDDVWEGWNNTAKLWRNRSLCHPFLFLVCTPHVWNLPYEIVFLFWIHQTWHFRKFPRFPVMMAKLKCFNICPSFSSSFSTWKTMPITQHLAHLAGTPEGQLGSWSSTAQEERGGKTSSTSRMWDRTHHGILVPVLTLLLC